MRRQAAEESPVFVDGAYRSVPVDPPAFARFFPGLGFYTRFAWFVCKGSNRARRGHYGDADWSRNSFRYCGRSRPSA